MKKSVIVLLLLVVLSLVAYYLINRRGWTTVKKELSDFAITDTASVTRIFLADKSGNSVLMERGNDGWKLNQQMYADPEKVMILLGTLHDVKVRNPIPESEFNTVIAMLASSGVKAEFYMKDGSVKIIYVGSSTLDQTGTYMLIDGSSSPYVTHIPGFVGYLTPRFLPSYVQWKDRKVIDLSESQIQSIKMDYPTAPHQSFEMINAMEPVLNDGKGLKVTEIDKGFCKFYAASFKRMYAEGYEDISSAKFADSILAMTPYCVLQIQDDKSKLHVLRIFLKGVDKRTKMDYDDQSDKRMSYDGDKFYATLDDSKDIMVIQRYVFDRVLKTRSDFEQSN
jgi:hypothetical protein